MALSFFQVIHQRYGHSSLQVSDLGSVVTDDTLETPSHQSSQSSEPEPENIGLDDARLEDSQESIIEQGQDAAAEETSQTVDPDQTGGDMSYFMAPSLVPMTPVVAHRGSTPPEPDLQPPSSLNTPAYGPTTTPTPTNTPSSEISYSSQSSIRSAPVYSRPAEPVHRGRRSLPGTPITRRRGRSTSPRTPRPSTEPYPSTPRSTSMIGMWYPRTRSGR